MARRTGEETRKLLLQTAAEMLLARGIVAGVAHIRLQDVVRRARLTTGAAYRLWPNQDDFHRDLALEVIRMRDEAPAVELQQLFDDPELAGIGWDEVIRLASAAHLRSLRPRGTREDRLFLTALALRAAAGSQQDLARAGADRHRQSEADYEEGYAMLMRAHGYRMRSPLRLADFTAAMAALAEGFAIQSVEGIPHPSFGPDPGPGPEGCGPDACGPEGTGSAAIDLGGRRWTLMGLAVRALVEGFMVRDEPAEESER